MKTSFLRQGNDMKRSDKEIEYLLKSIDVSDRKFFIISPDFKILTVNRYTSEQHNHDVIGKLCHETFYECSSPCKGCPAVGVVETFMPALREKQYDKKSFKWESCQFSYPIIEDKKIGALVLLDFERPGSMAVEEELKRSNAFFRNLISSSIDGVIATNMKGKILIFNDAAAEISGISVREALSGMDIRSIYPDDVARGIMEKLRSEDYGGKGKLKSYRMDVTRDDGKTIPILLNAALVYEGEREVASIGFFHDMSEELKMKSDLEKTHVQLLQAEKMSALGKLSAGVAHQLNNPLGGITLFAKLLLEEYDLEEAAQDDLKRILLDAERCRDTVKELLEFARQTSHIIQPHNINKAILRTLFLLENQSLFQNVKIIKDLSEDLPDVPVDMQQMNHVFMNIILNAAQAMEGHGTLNITTGIVDNQDKAFIKISDTGPGIPEDVLPQIFDPFFTTKDEGQGTGLGLSMVYGIIQDHKGNISVKSTVGEGTTFNIELPLKYKNHEGENSGEQY